MDKNMNRIKELAKKIFDLDEKFSSRSGGAHEISLRSIRNRTEEPDQLATDFDHIAKYIDHTILKPDATPEQIKQICVEAENHNFRSVCVNPSYVRMVKNNLESVEVCSVIGFPLGMNTTRIKIAETEKAILDGASEIDMVINIGQLKAGNFEYVLDEVSRIYEICRDHNVILKVIIETCLLTEDEKIIAALITKKGGADFVKTSTGFSSGGATVEDVALLRKVVGNKVGVKASGGVRTRAKALEMLDAGANRIGASSSIKLLEGEE